MEVSTTQFFEAVDRGDAPTIAAFFTHNASSHDDSVSPRLRRDATLHERSAGCEWLLPATAATDYADYDSLLGLAIRRHYVDVLEWLFSDAAIETIEPQRLVQAVEAACYFAMSYRALPIVELLLTSPVFTQLVREDAQQALLDRLLCIIPDTSDVGQAVRLLTAHGARVRLEDPQSVSPVLLRAGRRCDLELFHAIDHEGALEIGARVLDYVWGGGDIVSFATLSARGLLPIDAGSSLRRDVDRGYLTGIEVWLKEAFVDADDRDAKGRTALMYTGNTSPYDAPTTSLRINIAKLLLSYGASVSVKDLDGLTPLHHHVGCCDAEIIRLLLEHGANPNDRTYGGSAALDFLDVQVLDNPSIVSTLEYLLQYGANLFAPRKDGISVVDRLKGTESGRAFIIKHNLADLEATYR